MNSRSRRSSSAHASLDYGSRSSFGGLIDAEEKIVFTDPPNIIINRNVSPSVIEQWKQANKDKPRPIILPVKPKRRKKRPPPPTIPPPPLSPPSPKREESSQFLTDHSKNLGETTTLESHMIPKIHRTDITTTDMTPSDLEETKEEENGSLSELSFSENDGMTSKASVSIHGVDLKTKPLETIVSLTTPDTKTAKQESQSKKSQETRVPRIEETPTFSGSRIDDDDRPLYDEIATVKPKTTISSQNTISPSKIATPTVSIMTDGTSQEPTKSAFSAAGVNVGASHTKSVTNEERQRSRMSSAVKSYKSHDSGRNRELLGIYDNEGHICFLDVSRKLLFDE